MDTTFPTGARVQSEGNATGEQWGSIRREENATHQAEKLNLQTRDTTKNLLEEALVAATAAPKKKAAVQRKPTAADKAAHLENEATPASAQLVQQNIPKESVL